MGKILNLMLALVILASLSLFGCSSQPQSTEVIKLSNACYFPPTHAFSAMQEQWGKDIMARSNGRVEITFYPGGSLVKAPAAPDALQQGVADIANSHIGYTPGRFPMSEALDLPLGYPSGWVGSHVALDFMNKYKPKEWNSLHLLVVHAGTTAGLETRDKKVTKLEDMKGLTLRGAGEVAEAITALGATARDVPMVEMYDAVSKGVVDGTLVGIETLQNWNMADVCKYATFAWQVGNMYTFYIAMNKDKWDSMPKDIQKIFTEVSEEYNEKFALKWNELDVNSIKYAIDKGISVIALSDAEGQRFKDAVQPVMTNYVNDMVSAGNNKGDVEGWLKYIQERISYWMEKEKEQNIQSPMEIKLPTG